MTTVKPYLYAALVMLLGALSFGVYYYHDAYSDEQGKTERLMQETADQASVITKQAFEFNRFNQISQQASQYATNIKGQSDDKQIVYRTIIKRDPTGRQCVPDDVASRLLEYAHRLRSSAMHAVTSGINATGVSSFATTCRLTYAQAVYWIDPLLTAIDQANSQLAGIRQAEEARQEKANVQR